MFKLAAWTLLMLFVAGYVTALRINRDELAVASAVGCVGSVFLICYPEDDEEEDEDDYTPSVKA